MHKLLASFILVASITGLAHAADPLIGWRNDGSGQYPAYSGPTKWSATQNILWITEVGTGISSPILVGQRLFVTAEPMLLICLDAATGKELWRKSHSVADFPAALAANVSDKPNQYGDANPTPVSDGKTVWAFFSPGIVACYDLDGHAKWSNWFDMPPATNYGRTASPVLCGDKLLVHFGPLVCLDAATGKQLWRNDKAKATYGTPIITRIGNVDIAFTPGGHAVRLSDGKLLASDIGHCTYTTPLIQGKTIYFIDTSISAVQLPEKPGDTIEAKELWFEDLEGEFFASAILHNGRIYAVNRDANFFIIDAQTGKTLQKKTLDLPPAGRTESPNIYPSLCLAGNHLLISNDAGQSLLLNLDDQLTPLSTNTLPAGSGATPIFANDRMFIRGGKFLYCIAPKSP